MLFSGGIRLTGGFCRPLYVFRFALYGGISHLLQLLRFFRRRLFLPCLPDA